MNTPNKLGFEFARLNRPNTTQGTDYTDAPVIGYTSNLEALIYDTETGGLTIANTEPDFVRVHTTYIHAYRPTN